MKKSLMMKKIFIYMIDFLCQIKILLLNKKNMFKQRETANTFNNLIVHLNFLFNDRFFVSNQNFAN